MKKQMAEIQRSCDKEHHTWAEAVVAMEARLERTCEAAAEQTAATAVTTMLTHTREERRRAQEEQCEGEALRSMLGACCAGAEIPSWLDSPPSRTFRVLRVFSTGRFLILTSHGKAPTALRLH
eukprot:SAG11_NODE_298_length_11076_cov_4.253621_6_plen_123_part_00